MTAPVKDLSVGFFGGGLMAEAIIQRLLAKSVAAPSSIFVSEPARPRQDALRSLGVVVTSKPQEMLARSQVVIIAVKPNIASIVLRDITIFERNRSKETPRLYISICAGLKLAAFLEGNDKRKCARVMPNQPCIVGEAASGFSVNRHCTDKDIELVKLLFGSCGIVEEVKEELLNAVTGVSGSGPAYVFMMIEAMTDAGVREGLPRQVAKKLAAQTVFGAAKMVLELEEVHPAELRNRVESPAGTTIAGTATLEAKGFRSAIIEAVANATERAIELGGDE